MRLVSYTGLDAAEKNTSIIQQAEKKSRIDKSIHNIVYEDGSVKVDKEKPYKTVDANGKETDLAKNKLKNEYLGEVYIKLSNEKKANRIWGCREMLEFAFSPETDERKLHRAITCQCRLCPMCAKAKSLKNFHNLSQVITVAEKDYVFLFLTLTVQNCKGEELKLTLDNMTKAFNKLMKRRNIRGWGVDVKTRQKNGVKFKEEKPYNGVVKGFYRALEITHNLDKTSEWYDTYHPHFHIALAVNKSYFKSKDYMKQEEWAILWEEICLNYGMTAKVVDIRKFKARKKDDGTFTSPENELSKYVTKDSDYLIEDDEEMTLKTVKVLDVALHKKRLTDYGGVLKDIYKKLNLKEEDGEEVTELNEKLTWIIETVKWNIGYKNYYHIKNELYEKEQKKGLS